jgi:hypothetical protein
MISKPVSLKRRIELVELSKEEWDAIRGEVDQIDRLRQAAISPPRAPAAQEHTAASWQLPLPL